MELDLPSTIARLGGGGGGLRHGLSGITTKLRKPLETENQQRGVCAKLLGGRQGGRTLADLICSESFRSGTGRLGWTLYGIATQKGGWDISGSSDVAPEQRWQLHCPRVLRVVAQKQSAPPLGAMVTRNMDVKSATQSSCIPMAPYARQNPHKEALSSSRDLIDSNHVDLIQSFS
ncbi:hypothetical protein QJS10_CPA07g00520 [Acorus calamus]|uniref:Uncharacterized protein n=1 Tax=Acorus calamus TaxID=4465 RepID=A0AAV9EF74_ACOCL|nr:hypothetical protein QJS10_CPA07g00520 [Acorus calamus]